VTEEIVPPPNDVKIEAGVLGAILMGGPIGTRALDVALESLQPESFYSEANRQTFAAVQIVREKGVTVDVLSVLGCLRDRGRLAQIGGSGYVEQLVQAALLGTGFDAHIQRLVDLHRLRAFIHETRAQLAQAYGAGQDAAGFLVRAEAKIREVAQRGEKRTGEVLDTVVKRVLREAAESMKAPGRIVGMPTGVDGLDSRTAGFRPGTVTIVAGRPSMGKSALAFNWALTMARETGKYVPFFSLEMSNDEQGTRAISIETSVPMGVLVTGNITPMVMGQLIAYPQTVRGVPLILFDECDITTFGIGAKVRRLQAEAATVGKEVGAVFVDYLQLVKSAKRNQSREADVSEVSRSLKLLAKELKLPFVVLAQLNREGEKGTKPERPKLSQLRESGAIEQDADIVILIHREGYYDHKLPDDVAELIIAKGRNIQRGTVKVKFEGKHTRFGRTEIDRDDRNDA
jgi:replicative DNA helicase